MAKDPAILAHQEWLGYVQPVGLVVSIPAMLDASVRVNQNFAPEHRNFLEALPTGKDGEPIPEAFNFPEFAESVLGWPLNDLYGALGSAELPTSLEVSLPDYNETLRPTYALREFEPAENASEWILLTKVLPKGTDFDAVEGIDSRNWQASPQAKFERLLRQVRVPIGLLVNGQQIRLVYTPDKELSGYVTFKLADMVTVAGRPIFGAFQMLLSSERLYSVAERERLPAILENSRKYQNVVSTQLASQVLEALYELLRGFQAANDQTQGQLLHDVLGADPDHVYRGLLTTLLRMVFVLYAEDRDLLSTDSVFANYYSITGLYERLRVDDGRYPDTMDQRYGAWAQLLTLFRLVYRGGSHGVMRIPARDGYLFDPDRYLFLEGRRSQNDEVSIPRVPDGVLFRVLSKLMLLDGERISYRTLAVEQIGSVYEAIMGFELHVASGPSIAIKPAKKHGAPTTINLEALLKTAPDKRLKWFTDETDQKLTGKAVDLLKAAASINDLMNALERKIASSVTPGIVAKNAMIFQPSDERRRSGSHYTPSSLTGPIVEAALAPVLKQLGDNPTPAQILNLKVCDPAMGSGAFLVETCRQLGGALSRAWHAHNESINLPLDEDEELHAQRQVAQRCLYGVDKNPMATDLAKLSLWLATLAKDHPFTFLDHSLRVGDSLVGLTRKQIAAFNWNPSAQLSLLEQRIRKTIETVGNYRQQIFAARDDVPYALLKQKLDSAEDALNLPRQIGDAVIAAFFAGQKAKDRENIRTLLNEHLTTDLRDHGFVVVEGAIDKTIAKLKAGAKSICPFHWELEFPEVFVVDERGEQTGGFDVIVGNPPFMGGNQISTSYGMTYFAWIASQYTNCGGICDLVAYFFRRSFALLRKGGAQGLIATKTISEGDTRQGSLKWIRENGGDIYEAIRRRPWPGEAAVVVTTVHIAKAIICDNHRLDSRSVSSITSYLLPTGGDEAPASLAGQNEMFSQGTNPRSPGFVFDDSDDECSPLAEIQRIRQSSPSEISRIHPYIGGEEINQSPRQEPSRYIIFLNDVNSEDGLKAFPELAQIVRAKVKPGRDKLSNNPNNDKLRRRWWVYHAARDDFYSQIRGKSRVLVNSQVSNKVIFAFQPSDRIFSLTLNIYDLSSYQAFATLQSGVHDIWARLLGSHMKDDLRYTPSTCFETFPFPESYESSATLEAAGKIYEEFRANMMVRNDEGLTTTYNRFHNPNEDSTDFQRLRELHSAMDRAVLDAYGWQDLQLAYDFFSEVDDEDEEPEDGSSTGKKYRYRWPNVTHDDVLARLLDLNRKRALEEGQLLIAEQSPSIASKGSNKKNVTRSNRRSPGPNSMVNLFAGEEEKA
jgi:hypothetical protein